MRRLLHGLLLVLALAGCDEAKGGLDGATLDAEAGAGQDLQILPFTPPEVTLTANDTYEQWVTLSRPVDGPTHVNVTSGSAGVSVSPLDLVYAKGEEQQKATITAASDTSDLFVPVTFSVQGGTAARTLRVKVVLW